jgi:hypothetical protein
MPSVARGVMFPLKEIYEKLRDQEQKDAEEELKASNTRERVLLNGGEETSELSPSTPHDASEKTTSKRDLYAEKMQFDRLDVLLIIGDSFHIEKQDQNDSIKECARFSSSLFLGDCSSLSLSELPAVLDLPGIIFFDFPKPDGEQETPFQTARNP